MKSDSRIIRDNPKSSYKPSTGELTWGDETINPGDYINVKHRTSDGYSYTDANEAGMFLGVEGDFICFQTGVKKQKARILETQSIEVKSRFSDNEEDENEE